MQFRTALFPVALALLAGCAATMSPVTPTGQADQYTVTNRVTGRMTTWVELKSAAMERAGQYCQSLGKKMTHPTVTSNHATGFTPQEAYVTFSCQPIPESKTTSSDDKGSDTK